MSELARITAHYFAVLLERAGMSASVADMRAELEAAAEADRMGVDRAVRAEVLDHARQHEANVAAEQAAGTPAAAEPEPGRQARRRRRR